MVLYIRWCNHVTTRKLSGIKFSKRTLFSQINERPFCKKCKTFPGTDIDSEKVQLGPWLFNRTIASDKNIKKLYFKSKTARCGNSMHASNWKKDAKNWHTRCARWCNNYNIDNNLDNQSWQPFVTTTDICLSFSYIYF